MMKAFFIFFFLLSPLQIFACQCMNFDLNRDIENAKAIFIGTVSSKEILQKKVKYTFIASKFWKGATTQEVVLFSGFGGPDCGIELEVGNTYIVWALDNGYGNLQTNRCTRTTLLEASIDIDYLNHVFEGASYSEKRLTKNEIAVLCKRIDCNPNEIATVSLYYHEDRLIDKLEFLDQFTDFFSEIWHLKFTEKELTHLPKNAQEGLLVFLDFNKRNNKRKRIIKNLIKVNNDSLFIKSPEIQLGVSKLEKAFQKEWEKISFAKMYPNYIAAYDYEIMDEKTGMKFTVDSTEIYVSAYSKDHKLLWKRDPWKEEGLTIYRHNKPVIVQFELITLGSDWGKSEWHPEKEVIWIRYSNSQMGWLDKITGDYFHYGQD